MTWNPVRFAETLIHFRVAGPLRSMLDNLPFVSQTLDAPLPAVLTPASPQGTILVDPLEVGNQNRLRAAATNLGYRVEPMPSGAEGEPLQVPSPLVNVPVMVWSGAKTSATAPIALAELVAHLSQTATVTEACLVDLRHPTAALKELWGALDDVVMGGVSSSQAQWDDGLMFTGNVSTENSGGFASIRTRNVDPPMNLSQWQGTVLHLRGDGQRYKWILRDSPGWDSLAYIWPFDTTPAAPTVVRAPFQDMVATFRARSKPDASPLNPSQICSMQLMLSKFEYDGDLNPTFKPGPFKLNVSQIGVYRDAPKPLILLPGLADAERDQAQAQLGEAHLMGVVPQEHGFEVIGAGDQLPGWISQDRVGRLCRGITEPS